MYNIGMLFPVRSGTINWTIISPNDTLLLITVILPGLKRVTEMGDSRLQKLTLFVEVQDQ